MLKPNLRFQQELQTRPILWVLNWLLFICLCGQIILMGIRYHRSSNIIEELKPLKERLATLEEKKASLWAITEKTKLINGALMSRNQWMQDRMKSPSRMLAALEQDRPKGVVLKFFNATRSGGSLKALTPDTGQIACWVNAAFINKTGILTVEEKIEGKLLVSYSWTD